MKYTVFPDSVRLDPVNVRLYEHQPKLYKKTIPADFLENNSVWNRRDNVIRLKAAGREYVAFQVALISEKECKEIKVSLSELKGPAVIPQDGVEFFKEWFVEVQTPSSGYEKTTLGTGWYPDALIPFSAKPQYYGAPFYVPDYWNRIKGQKAGAVWADIYIPEQQKPGDYHATLTITSPDFSTIEIPLILTVWPFTLPNANSLKGNIYTNFFRKWSFGRELRYQHIFKKHRIANHQCYYRPELTIVDNEPRLDWSEFDARLAKYFDGSAFTDKFGYYGPGYGEPMEYFLLPFNCSGKKNAIGWPLDTTIRQDESFWRIWEKTAREVRKHLFEEKRLSSKTQVQIFFNALDECYKPEDLERMVMWSKLTKKHFPEALFRIDGGYTDEIMAQIAPHVDLCIYHTVAYDLPIVEKYRAKGIRDWIYGPMVYESKTNELTGASSFIDLDMLTMRGLGWVSYKYNADSWCQWEFGWRSKQAWHNPENFKDKSLEEFRCYNGNGMMLYDGEAMDLPDPCVSIRFKAGRSGSQEYEYLKLFKELGGNPSEIVDSLIDKPLGSQCIGNLEPWNTNVAAWDEARLKLGDAIAKRV